MLLLLLLLLLPLDLSNSSVRPQPVLNMRVLFCLGCILAWYKTRYLFHPNSLGRAGKKRQWSWASSKFHEKECLSLSLSIFHSSPSLSSSFVSIQLWEGKPRLMMRVCFGMKPAAGGGMITGKQLKVPVRMMALARVEVEFLGKYLLWTVSVTYAERVAFVYLYIRNTCTRCALRVASFELICSRDWQQSSL